MNVDVNVKLQIHMRQDFRLQAQSNPELFPLSTSSSSANSSALQPYQTAQTQLHTANTAHVTTTAPFPTASTAIMLPRRRTMAALAAIAMSTYFWQVTEKDPVPKGPSPPTEIDLPRGLEATCDGGIINNAIENGMTGLFDYATNHSILLSTGGNDVVVNLTSAPALGEAIEKPPFWLALVLVSIACSLLAAACLCRRSISALASSTMRAVRTLFPSAAYQAAIRRFSDLERRMPSPLRLFLRRFWDNYLRYGIWADLVTPFIPKEYASALWVSALPPILAVVLAALSRDTPRRDQQIVELQEENDKLKAGKKTAEEQLIKLRRDTERQMTLLAYNAQVAATTAQKKLDESESDKENVENQYDRREKYVVSLIFQKRMAEQAREDLEDRYRAEKEVREDHISRLLREAAAQRGSLKVQREHVATLTRHNDHLENEIERRATAYEMLMLEAESAFGEKCVDNKRKMIKIRNLNKQIRSDEEDLLKIERLEAQLEGYESATTNRVTEDLEDELRTVKKEKQDLLQKINGLEAQLQEYKSTKMNPSTENLGKELKTANEKNEALLKKIYHLETELKKYDSSKMNPVDENLREELKTANGKNEKLLQKINGLEARLEEYQSSEMNPVNENLRQELEGFKRMNTENLQLIEELEAQKKEYESSEPNSAVGKLQHELEAVKKENKDYLQEITEMEDRLQEKESSKLDTSYDNLQHQLEQALDKSDELQHELDKAWEKRDESEEKLKNEEWNSRTHGDNMKRLEENNAKLLEEKNAALQKVAAHVASAKPADTQARVEEGESSNLKRVIETLQTKLEKANENGNTLRQQLKEEEWNSGKLVEQINLLKGNTMKPAGEGFTAPKEAGGSVATAGRSKFGPIAPLKKRTAAPALDRGGALQEASASVASAELVKVQAELKALKENREAELTALREKMAGVEEERDAALQQEEQHRGSAELAQAELETAKQEKEKESEAAKAAKSSKSFLAENLRRTQSKLASMTAERDGLLKEKESGAGAA